MLYPATGTQYDVLLVTPERSDSATAEHKRVVSEIKSATGLRRVTDRYGVPLVTRPFLWRALSRPEIATLRAFVAARQGRVVPVWVPTNQQDLPLAKPGQVGEPTLTIERVMYAAMVFPLGNARRHIAVLHDTGAVQCYRITGATDNHDGTETLVLDSPLSAAVSVDTRISFLTLCRLAEDSVEYNWDTPGIVDATLQFVDLPLETP